MLTTSYFARSARRPGVVSIARSAPPGFAGAVYTTLAPPGPDAVLLCWERSGTFCHRRLVAAWLHETLGLVVPELGTLWFADI